MGAASSSRCATRPARVRVKVRVWVRVRVNTRTQKDHAARINAVQTHHAHAPTLCACTNYRHMHRHYAHAPTLCACTGTMHTHMMLVHAQSINTCTDTMHKHYAHAPTSYTCTNPRRMHTHLVAVVAREKNVCAAVPQALRHGITVSERRDWGPTSIKAGLGAHNERWDMGPQ